MGNSPYSRSLPLLLLLLFSLLLAGDTLPTFNATPAAFTTSLPIPYPYTASDVCIGRCAYSLVEELSRHMPPSASPTAANSQSNSPASSLGFQLPDYNDFLTAFSNATFFSTFCHLYTHFQHCHGKCPPCQMQSLLRGSAEIVDLFCIHNYQPIVQRFGCLARMDQGSSRECLQQCTSPASTTSGLLQSLRRGGGEGAGLERELEQSCEYVLCTLNCDLPLLMEVCEGEGTAELVLQLTQKSFDSMHRLVLEGGLVERWPRMCGYIAGYELPSRRRVDSTSTVQPIQGSMSTAEESTQAETSPPPRVTTTVSITTTIPAEPTTTVVPTSRPAPIMTTQRRIDEGISIGRGKGKDGNESVGGNGASAVGWRTSEQMLYFLLHCSTIIVISLTHYLNIVGGM